MPKITKELTVDAPVDSVWHLISDMERFGACIPGCKQVRRVSDTEFDWVLEARVLRTTRKLTARTRATQMHAPWRAEYCGEGRLFEQSNHYRLNLQGTTNLEDLGHGKTRVRFEGQVNASGIGGALIDKIAAGQMDELFANFEENMKLALAGTDAGQLHPTSTSAGSNTTQTGPLQSRLLVSGGILIVLFAGLLILATR